MYDVHRQENSKYDDVSRSPPHKVYRVDSSDDEVQVYIGHLCIVYFDIITCIVYRTEC